jgi:hypothetical protein
LARLRPGKSIQTKEKKENGFCFDFIQSRWQRPLRDSFCASFMNIGLKEDAFHGSLWIERRHTDPKSLPSKQKKGLLLIDDIVQNYYRYFI